MFKSLLTAFIGACLMLSTGPLPAQSPIQRMTYTASADNFPNPERGFYIQRAPLWLNGEREALGHDDLEAARAGGSSVVRTYYILDRYRDRPLDDEVLAALTTDMATARAEGFKLIVRFGYNFPTNSDYTEALDAPLDVVLHHIDQLTLALRANVDVIAHMEAGFVGAWGEWHSSSNQLIDYPRRGINAASEAILLRLLDALPTIRMIAVRYPLIKQQLFATAAPLTEVEAFNGSPQARIGAHDDCFLASDTNWGTYIDAADEPQIAAYMAFLNADNRFVVQSGETCNSTTDAQPFIGCANALEDLAYLRWSSLNLDYHPGVLDGWRAEGCFDEIARRLGYRLRLTEASAVVTDDSLVLQLGVVNDGFASPYNPRGFILVLRGRDGVHHPLTLAETPDPRFWLPGAPITVDLQAAIPAGLATGTYSLLLALPDPQPTLADDPRYSIRLANDGLWDEATGYHDLGLSVMVDESSWPPAPAL